MENNSERNYDQQGRNSQDQESRNWGNRLNSNEGDRNAGSNRPENHGDVNSTGFDFGTNAEDYIANNRDTENKDRNARFEAYNSSSSQLYSTSGRSDLADNGIRSSDQYLASDRNVENEGG